MHTHTPEVHRPEAAEALEALFSLPSKAFRALLRACLHSPSFLTPLFSPESMATLGLQRSNPPLTRGLWEVKNGGIRNPCPQQPFLLDPSLL